MNYDRPSLAADLERHIGSSVFDPTEFDFASIWKALDTAFEAHQGQYREKGDSRNAEVPYIAHPVGVAKLCLDMWAPDELSDDLSTVIIVALLHDVLEDTSVEFTTIEETFGRRVAVLCEALTKPNYSEISSRNERNELAARKILDAGPTAIFIKACDALHNISRPSAMPTGLLIKTVDKISGPYLRLLSGQPYEDRFARCFAHLLEKARSLIVSNNHTQGNAYTSLDTFLSAIKTKTNSKVFEEHDIAALFLSINGMHGSYIGFLDQVSANFDLRAEALDQKRLSDLRRHGQVELTGDDFNSARNAEARFKVFSVSLLNPILASDPRRLILIGDALELPSWLNSNVISVALAVLTERMLGKIRDRSLELASLINFHSLDLDVRRAADLGISVPDILDLVELNRFADLASEALMLLFRSYELMPELSSEIEKMEYRRKTAESIFKKRAARSYSSLCEIDDYVGFRFVFISSVERDELVVRFSKLLRDNSKGHARIEFHSSDNFTPHHVSTQNGYSSTHISIFGKTDGNPSLCVGCELQFRTISEDAVARITHELSYKGTKLSKSSKKTFNKEISRLRSEIDELVSNFSSRKTN